MVTELAVRDEVNVVAMSERPTSGLALSFTEMTMRVAQLDQFYREVMQEGTDYGKIPGTDKPTLYQPGAQMLDQIFGYAPTFEVMASSVIDWQRPIPFFHYVICCRLVSRRTNEVVAEGIGSCNSFEDKYRWRNAKRVCPDCKGEAIIKGKAEFGGGWLCFRKNGGCGAKFRDGDAAIEGQAVGRTENEDSASLENTISKMAQKRAHIAATLNATGASRIFTQDIEDLPQFQAALTVESRVQAVETQPTVATQAPAVERNEPPINAAEALPSAEALAKFEAQWKRGIAKSVAIGAVAPDKPKDGATLAEIRKAMVEMVEAVQTRQALVDDLTVKLGQVRALGGDVADVDPARATDAEIHDVLASLNAVLAASPSSDDDADAPF